MEAYSLDLRERVLLSCEDAFESRREIAENHGVSLSFVQKLWRRWQTDESAQARPRGRGPARLG